MVVNGKVVGLTTGTDIEGMKTRLFYGHFNLPDPSKTTKKSGGSTKKKRRGRS